MNKPKKNQIKKLNSLIVDHRNFVAAREFAEELNKDYPENTDIINSLASVYIFFKEIDKSIKLLEGIKLKNKAVFSVQYHPESNPGPQDSHYLFNQFINEVKKNAKKKRY